MALFPVGDLPAEPLLAAAHFHQYVLGRLKPAEDATTLVFAPADHTHRGWRLAVVQALARRWAPARVNAIAGDDALAIAAADAYLAKAPGVTGQYWPLATPAIED